LKKKATENWEKGERSGGGKGSSPGDGGATLAGRQMVSKRASWLAKRVRSVHDRKNSRLLSKKKDGKGKNLRGVNRSVEEKNLLARTRHPFLCKLKAGERGLPIDEVSQLLKGRRERQRDVVYLIFQHYVPTG